MDPSDDGSKSSHYFIYLDRFCRDSKITNFLNRYFRSMSATVAEQKASNGHACITLISFQLKCCGMTDGTASNDYSEVSNSEIHYNKKMKS